MQLLFCNTVEIHIFCFLTNFFLNTTDFRNRKNPSDYFPKQLYAASAIICRKPNILQIDSVPVSLVLAENIITYIKRLVTFSVIGIRLRVYSRINKKRAILSLLTLLGASWKSNVKPGYSQPNPSNGLDVLPFLFFNGSAGRTSIIFKTTALPFSRIKWPSHRCRCLFLPELC